ncbi:hypothetical protein [Paenibacillus sp. yr247]|nr:hypothetical protein [Paenibacillus sp. yr247]
MGRIGVNLWGAVAISSADVKDEDDAVLFVHAAIRTFEGLHKP